MKNGKLTVAIVGMGFGSCFLPIYLKHPDVEHVIMVDTNPDQLKALADMYLLDESYYTTGAHLVQCLGEEIIVDIEAQLVIGRVIYFVLAERYITYRKVKEISTVCCFKTCNGNIGLGVKLLGYSSGDGI